MVNQFVQVLSKINTATGNPCFCFTVECNVWEWLTRPHWKSQGGLVHKCIWYLVMVNKCPSVSWINAEVVLKIFTVVSSLIWLDTKHIQNTVYKSHYIQKVTKWSHNTPDDRCSGRDDQIVCCGRPKTLVRSTRKTLRYVQVIQIFNL